jgi:hypothetical protein
MKIYFEFRKKTKKNFPENFEVMPFWLAKNGKDRKIKNTFKNFWRQFLNNLLSSRKVSTWQQNLKKNW